MANAEAASTCADKILTADCMIRKASKECERNARFMYLNCQATCEACDFTMEEYRDKLFARYHIKPEKVVVAPEEEEEGDSVVEGSEL
eukprot:CAMPEP_0116028036 /NCGR_PEP_ID=MMETSP0321-20121206/15116_1 /TAXON_ID=163516 /ORGANISM="Leptocylindrus danicus var. danicus, Strain B650" /LENGTH=87 /DNA_ID=CAMNT_0003501767 /DNA_START=182 /DNA_END=445 /DNA_ORIENTATION=+